MSNVIPREGLKAVQKRNSARFLLLGSLMLAASAAVAILALVPAHLSVRIARAALDASAQEAAEVARSDQATATQTQRLIAVLKPVVSATSSPAELLATALAQKPTGLSITGISYTGGAKPTFVFTGVSSRREAVNAFRDALAGTGRFPKVDVPVSAIVGTQEGRFTITLSEF